MIALRLKPFVPVVQRAMLVARMNGLGRSMRRGSGADLGAPLGRSTFAASGSVRPGGAMAVFIHR
jgi:hypothetical protein